MTTRFFRVTSRSLIGVNSSGSAILLFSSRNRHRQTDAALVGKVPGNLDHGGMLPASRFLQGCAAPGLLDDTGPRTEAGTHDTGYCPVGFMFGIASVIGSLSAASAANISPAASSTG